jgi:hypothetical protein
MLTTRVIGVQRERVVPFKGDFSWVWATTIVNSITAGEFSLTRFVDNLAHTIFRFVFTCVLGKNHGGLDHLNADIMRCLHTE